VGGDVFLKDQKEIEWVELTAETLAAADCVVIITEHSRLDYGWIADHSRLLFDSRNVTGHLKPTRANIIRLGAPNR
jgi:UDP-N-acetyl-D-glucosamine dehydrogenase